MDNALSSFHKRQDALRRKHSRMSQGYVTRVNRNGLIEQVPDKKVGGFALGLIVRMALVVVGFKVLALSWLGEQAYAGHLEALSQGAAYEQAGAWLMQIDPVTRKLSDILMPLIG